MAAHTVKLPNDLSNRLATLCGETSRAKNYIVNQALKIFLDDQEDELIGIARLMRNEKEFDLEGSKAETVKMSESSLKDLQGLSDDDRKSFTDYLVNTLSREEDPRKLGKSFVNERSGLWHFIHDDLKIICYLNAKEILVIRISKKAQS